MANREMRVAISLDEAKISTGRVRSRLAIRNSLFDQALGAYASV